MQENNYNEHIEEEEVNWNRMVDILIESNYLKLELSERSINTFSNSILKVENLTHLDLSFNNIKRIPEEIGKLKQLRFLLLGIKKITKKLILS